MGSRNITETPRPGVLTGLGKGRAVAGAWVNPCPPLGLLAGAAAGPQQEGPRDVTWRRSNAARGLREEPQPSFGCKPKWGLGLTPFLSPLHPAAD